MVQIQYDNYNTTIPIIVTIQIILTIITIITMTKSEYNIAIWLVYNNFDSVANLISLFLRLLPTTGGHAYPVDSL